MGVTYRAIAWNSFKKRHDLVLVVGVLLYLSAFVGVSLALFPAFTFEILLIRAFGSAALLLLHLVLLIGPLARINRRWLPLLYNRRHLGVFTFLLSLVHALLVLLTYHAGTDLGLVQALLVTDLDPGPGEIPFQVFGLVALLILFVMAASSHDFWLANLTAPVWKTLHMSVYVAYVLLLAHVLFGVLQAEANPLYLILLGLGSLAVGTAHLWSGWKASAGARTAGRNQTGWIPVCPVEELVENLPRAVQVAGEQVALLRYQGNLVSAISGVCQHQNGPLAEGRFLDGCLICPWHGYQYDPATGLSPKPFTEAVPTFDVAVREGQVWVHSDPHPAGTAVTPVRLDDPKKPEVLQRDRKTSGSLSPFFIGWAGLTDKSLGRWLGRRVSWLLLTAAILGALLAWGQGTVGQGHFEFGTVRTVDGLFLGSPTPLLISDEAVAGENLFFLVSPLKFGIEPALARRHHLQRVRLQGTLIHDPLAAMLEVVPDTIEVLESEQLSAPDWEGETMGQVVLRGEIVDSKCFLGVMNPGRLKAHRACAQHCVRGGIPPLLRVEAADSKISYILLVEENGQPINQEVLPFLALPVEVSGSLRRYGKLKVLNLRPGTLRVLD